MTTTKPAQPNDRATQDLERAQQAEAAMHRHEIREGRSLLHMTREELEYEVLRAWGQRDAARGVNVRRTLERDTARGVLHDLLEGTLLGEQASIRCRKLYQDAELGAALRELEAQLHRLREAEVFDHSPRAQERAIACELGELAAERPGTSGYQAEACDGLGAVLHLVLLSDLTFQEAVQYSTAKIQGRLDSMDEGLTWAEAKAVERCPPKGKATE